MINYLNLIIILFVYMNLWYIYSLIIKRNDVADIAWGLGFVLMTWSSFIIAGQYQLKSSIVSILVTIWGLRLAWHIYSRNKKKSEDARYLAWRIEWGKWFYIRSYFQIYILQGTLLFLIVLPVISINNSHDLGINWLDFIGFTIWIIGFFFEVIGDFQLKEFIKNPLNKGKIMQEGLWAYSRHPNYFGEVTQWWGLWILALSIAGGWLTIVSPLTITFLILKISGVTMLEKKMEQNPLFAEYKRRVSVFIPLPPKNIPHN